jgi:GNAT superfamily N-acetyltransferase
MTNPALHPGYELISETPSIADYRRLRFASGLSPKSLEAATAGLPNTIFAVVIRQDSQAIAMGRIIGDGGLFYQVVDIAVDPAHQGKGLGKVIVANLVQHLREIALPGAYISLIADGEAHKLYAQFGFLPTAPASIGMYLPVA